MKCTCKPFLLLLWVPVCCFSLTRFYHCSNISRFLCVWRCSENNGNFQSILFSWKFQIDPSAFPFRSLRFSSLPLQAAGFVFLVFRFVLFFISFPYCALQSCLIPFSQVHTLSCLFILSPPFCCFAGSSSQTLIFPFLCLNPWAISAMSFGCFSCPSSWLHVILAVLIQPFCLPSEVLHSAKQ